jgi:tetratricopeptide (TPR) repeat protein
MEEHAMRCEFLRSLALIAAVWLVPGVSFGEIHLKDATAPASTESKPLPTPAKQKLGAKPTAAHSDAAPAPLAVSPADAKPKAGDEALRPIPDSLESGPISIEAASLKGVVPGVSTRAEVEKAWGAPREMAKQDGDIVQLFSVPPFQQVEVIYSGDKVASIVVRFDKAFPADAVAKQLDLATVRPVLVSNEMGDVLGLAYPERGVMFVFEAGKEAAKPSMKVSQVVLEPINAEPFLLRAETTLESRCDLSRRDLEQAIALEPKNARAQWLYARSLMAMDQFEKAGPAAAQAERLEPDNPRYRITLAQVLAQTGRLTEAIAEAQTAVAASEKTPHVKARALCMIGDLLASGAKPDYKKAIGFHTQAIQVADPLTTDGHPALRLAAKEILIDAHLGAAHDIAWGDWKEKDKAVARWLDRAQTVATDLIKNEGAGQDQLFRVYVRAMAAYVGARGAVNPEATAQLITTVGDELIDSASEPARKAQLQWDLGMALYDAVQICQMRSEHDKALKHGEKAAEYLAEASKTRQSSASLLLLGRLYFRLGTIHALRDRDHAAAIAWFDKAVPLFERSTAEEPPADPGRHGEALVSMGVSFWETSQPKKAVDLTEQGIKWMEKAVKQGSMDRASLAVPYNNLAAMHRQLGAADKADRFQEMASRAKTTKVK